MAWSALAQEVPPAEALSEQESMNFVRRMEKASGGRDPAFFRQNLDMGGILKRAMNGLNASPEAAAAFRKAFPASDTMAEMERDLGKSECQWLRWRESETGPCALFRTVRANGSLVYHELVLDRAGKGAARILDVAVVATGEWLSETARKNFLEILAGEKRSLWSRWWEKDPPEIQAVKDTAEFFRLGKARKFSEALAAWPQLPPVLQTNKAVLQQRFQAALSVSDKEILATQLAWQKTFPNNPALSWQAMEFYRSRKNPQKAIAAIEQLDTVIDDARLDLLKAAQYQALGAWEKCGESAQRALIRHPALREAYPFIFGSYLETLQYSEITQLLITLYVNHDKEDGTQYFSSHRKYDRYARSDAFSQWWQFLNPALAPARPVASVGASQPNAPGKPGVSGAATKIKTPNLKLQGVTLGGAKVSALINGQTLFLGEQIDLYIIRKIESGQVTLESPSGQETVLTLKEVYAP